MLYYFVEFAGSFANIALLLLFIGRLFSKKNLFQDGSIYMLYFLSRGNVI